MRPIQAWYWQEVERWRVGAAVAWGFLLLPPVLALFMVLANASFSLPVVWLFYGLQAVLSPYHWSYTWLLCVTMPFIAIWQTKYATVRPEVLGNRLACVTSALKPQKILLVCAHGVVGGFTAWCFASMLGGRYSSLLRGQPEVSLFVNEYHLFIVVHGAVTGMVYGIRFLNNTLYHITFPCIQQAKLFQVKRSVYPLLQGSLWNTLSQLKFFYLAYYLLLGSVVRGFILRNLSVHRSPFPVDTLAGMLDLGLLWQVTLSGTFLQLIFSLNNVLHTIYQAEPVEFELESEVEEEKAWCLNKALDCSKYPLLQYHAYQDLYLLSNDAGPRRQFVFQLSQPGGHPHNWMATSSQCLVQLKALVDSLQGLNDRAMAQGPARQMSGERPPVTLRAEPAPQPPPTFTMKVMAILKKWKVVALFLDELPGTATRRLFADCQLYIWSVEALSHLVAASYTADKFGVVQKSLPDILVTLLTLQEAMEKHMKWCPLSDSRKGSKNTSTGDMRAAFRATLKGAIYRIVATFKEHLKQLPLTMEHMRRLNQFMEYKE